MKKLSAFVAILSLLAMVLIVYEKAIVQGSFGANSILAIVVLAGVTLLCCFTFYNSDRRVRIRRLWSALISTFVTYVIFDLLAGFLLIPRLSPPVVPDEVLHHRLVPNSRSEFENREFSYIQRVNNLGLRGPDIAIEKPPSCYRIVMLGDSFTMGKGVQDHETFSALLEDALREPDGQVVAIQVETINAGVDSYAPILSALQLTKDLDRLDPNLVVFNLDMSDLVQEEIYRGMAQYTSDGAVLGVDGRREDDNLLTVRVRRWINRRLFMTRLVLFYTDRLANPKEVSVELAHPEFLRHTLAEDTKDRDEQWRRVFDSIRTMRAHCAERGRAFLLTVYPWGHQVDDTEWTPGRNVYIAKDAAVSDQSLERIRDFAVQSDVDLLDMFPAFRTYDGDAPIYFRYDPHWTPVGHEIMADQFERHIRSRLHDPS